MVRYTFCFHMFIVSNCLFDFMFYVENVKESSKGLELREMGANVTNRD